MCWVWTNSRLQVLGICYWTTPLTCNFALKKFLKPTSSTKLKRNQWCQQNRRNTLYVRWWKTKGDTFNETCSTTVCDFAFWSLLPQILMERFILTKTTKMLTREDKQGKWKQLRRKNATAIHCKETLTGHLLKPYHFLSIISWSFKFYRKMLLTNKP